MRLETRQSKEEKALYNKQQLVFAKDGAVVSNDFKFAKIEPKKIDFNLKATCPFCLSWASLNKFLISTKKGYNQGLEKCPSCGCGMKLKTLFALGKWKPEDYAAFVVEYPFGAFWAKLSKAHLFDVWKDRLKLMKWSTPFWQEYHRLNPPKDKPTKEEDDEYAGYEASQHE